MSSAVALLVLSVVVPSGAPAEDVRPAVARLVSDIQHADYAGDRAALQRLHDELAPFVNDSRVGSRVQYWRGFALWRRALNGFNEKASPADLERDLTSAVADFRDALARDPAFVDAKIGAASCLVNDSFLNLSNKERARELFTQSNTLLDEAAAAAPDNPRLLWVKGANQFYSPPERGGGQDVAIATYQRGLKIARQQKRQATDSLDPAWGEPELLMNLAFAYYNRATPDYDAAEKYARDALALVPYWHYVRDILMLQIQQAKRGVRSENAPFLVSRSRLKSGSWRTPIEDRSEMNDFRPVFAVRSGHFRT